MAFAFLTFWGVGMLVVARWTCGRWVNHLSLYTCLWTITLLTVQLRLIVYNHIVIEAWFYILIAWVAIYLGTAVVRLMIPSVTISRFPQLNMPRLRNAIVLLSLAGMASTIVLARNIVDVLRTDGLFAALTEYANQIYGLRLENEVTGLTYIVFLPYSGCVLAGIYTARIGRLTLPALLPMLVMTLDGIVSMQRAAMIIGPMLFFFAYAASPKASTLKIARWQKIGLVALALGAIISVTAHRGGVETYAGESDTLVRAGDVVSVLPVSYLYATASVPCFSEYLKHPDEDGKALWGRYMFASLYRFLSKVGFDTYVPYYPNYYYVPLPVNTGTYLRDIHRDFGGLSIFLYPFMLGAFITFLESRGVGLFSCILLCFLYVVVTISIYYNFIGGGGWYFPLPISLLVAALVRAPRTRSSVCLRSETSSASV